MDLQDQTRAVYQGNPCGIRLYLLTILYFVLSKGAHILLLSWYGFPPIIKKLMTPHTYALENTPMFRICEGLVR